MRPHDVQVVFSPYAMSHADAEEQRLFMVVYQHGNTIWAGPPASMVTSFLHYEKYPHPLLLSHVRKKYGSVLGHRCWHVPAASDFTLVGCRTVA